MERMASSSSMDKVEFMSHLYEVGKDDIRSDTEVVVTYGTKTVKIGIPVYKDNKYQQSIKEWAKAFWENVVLYLHGKDYTAVQRVYSQITRLAFNFDMQYSCWDIGVKNDARAKAVVLAEKYWNGNALKLESVDVLPFETTGMGTTHQVRAVFHSAFVDVKETQRMFGVESICMQMTEDRMSGNLMEQSFVEDGMVPCLEMHMIGTPIKGKTPAIPVNKDQFCHSMYTMLGGAIISNKRTSMKPLVFSSFVLDTLAARAREDRDRQREERRKELEDFYSRVDIPMSGINLKDDEMLDEHTLMSKFTDPQDADFVMYMNKFIVHIRGSKSSFGVKRMNSMTGQIHLLEVPDVSALRSMFPHCVKLVQVEDEDPKTGKLKARKKRMRVVDAWLEHEEHLMVDDTVFFPGKPTLMRCPIRKDLLENHRSLLVNTFPEFAYKIYTRRYTRQQLEVGGPVPQKGYNLQRYMEMIEAKPVSERTYLEVLLDHIYRVYCSRNPIMFWAFNAFFYNIFTHPMKRMGACLMIVGMFGVGKSVFFQALGRYGFGEGTLYQYFGGDGSRLTGRFNSGFQGLLIFIDEAENSDATTAGKTKSMITEDVQMTEAKYQTPKLVHNYANFVYCGNSLGQKIMPGDRRYWTMECDPSAKQSMTKEMRNKLAEACGKYDDPGPIGICQYIVWLQKNKVGFEDFDFYVQPYMTPNKRHHIMRNMHGVYKWWKDVLLSQLQPHSSKRSISTFLEGAQWEEDPNKGKWNGESTWAILWAHYQSTNGRHLGHTLFEQLLTKCVVIREKPVVAGEEFKAHADRPLYFGCLAACWAQFEIFLRVGSVHDSTETLRGVCEYEDTDWIKELFIKDYKECKQKGLGDQPSTFHDRCELCGRSSRAWEKLSQSDIAALRVETIQAVESEERGELPAVFHKQERGEACQRVSPAQDGERQSERSSHDEGSADPWSDPESDSELGEAEMLRWRGADHDMSFSQLL